MNYFLGRSALDLDVEPSLPSLPSVKAFFLCVLCVLLLKVFAGLLPFLLLVLIGVVWCSLVLFGPKIYFRSLT